MTALSVDVTVVSSVIAAFAASATFLFIIRDKIAAFRNRVRINVEFRDSQSSMDIVIKNMGSQPLNQVTCRLEFPEHLHVSDGTHGPLKIIRDTSPGPNIPFGLIEEFTLAKGQEIFLGIAYGTVTKDTNVDLHIFHNNKQYTRRKTLKAPS